MKTILILLALFTSIEILCEPRMVSGVVQDSLGNNLSGARIILCKIDTSVKCIDLCSPKCFYYSTLKTKSLASGYFKVIDSLNENTHILIFLANYKPQLFEIEKNSKIAIDSQLNTKPQVFVLTKNSFQKDGELVFISRGNIENFNNKDLFNNKKIWGSELIFPSCLGNEEINIHNDFYNSNWLNMGNIVFILPSNKPNTSHLDSDSPEDSEDFFQFNKGKYKKYKIKPPFLEDTEIIVIPIFYNKEIYGNIMGKPVIYLYPETIQDVQVKIDFVGKINNTYPKYKDKWAITAHPDGRLVDANNREYPYLFWDGIIDSFQKSNYETGFVIKSDTCEEFFEQILDKIGFTPKERTDFITYWAPYLKKSKYSYIYFRINKECDSLAKLSVSPKPDTEIRLYMEFKALQSPIKVNEQKLNKIERNGFTLVEWGGMEINSNNSIEAIK